LAFGFAAHIAAYGRAERASVAGDINLPDVTR
jgi:hypothetical protein